MEHTTSKKMPAAMHKDLLSLMLRKAKLKYDDLITSSEKRWIAQNLDLLTESEVKRFQPILLQ